MNELQSKTFDSLYEKYGTMLLSKKQTAEILGTSEAVLNRDKANGIGLEYQQTGSAGTVKYSLGVIVEAITGVAIKTA